MAEEQVTQQVNGTPTTPAPAPVDPGAEKRKEREELTKIAEREREKLARRQQEQAQRNLERQQYQQMQREAAEARAKAEMLEKEFADPLAFLEKRGITAKQIGDRILKQGTVDEMVAQAMAKAEAAERRAEKLEKEAAEREAHANARARDLEARASIARDFEAIKDKCPIMRKFSPERVVREYQATYNMVIADPVASLHSYDDRDLLIATEARLKADADEKLEGYSTEELEQLLTKRKAPASVEKEAQASAASGPQEKKPATQSEGKTLSASVTSGSSGGWKPDNWDRLPDKKQNEILLDRLRKGLPITD